MNWLEWGIIFGLAFALSTIVTRYFKNKKK